MRNTEDPAVAEKRRVRHDRLVLLEDPPPIRVPSRPTSVANPRPFVLAPCSVNSDEPILLAAACLLSIADKALALSDTRVLGSMFGAPALLARNTPEDIAARLREALSRRTELDAKSAALKERRLRQWRDPAETVARMLA